MPQPPFSAAVFDLDGTLLDTLADMARAMNRALVRSGLPTHSESAYRFFVGEGARVLAQKALPPERCDEAAAGALVQVYLEEYGAGWRDRTAPYDGIPEMLAQLQRQGMPLAVLSNKPHVFTQQCVAHYFPEIRFARVYGQRVGFPRKPDPTVARALAAELGAAPEGVLYAGDTAIDMQTARAAGLFAVGVTWGFREARELREGGAQALVDAPEALARLALGEAPTPATRRPDAR